jgi:hypothetical protein
MVHAAASSVLPPSVGMRSSTRKVRRQTRLFVVARPCQFPHKR